MQSLSGARWLRTLTAVFGFVTVSFSATAATSLTQFGITWTFDRDYPTGRFANGDFWVVGPVTIVDITPRSFVNANGATLHGSMTNPALNRAQGYDSRIQQHDFDPALNVARRFPITLPAGTSLLSAESLVPNTSGDKPQLKTIAILTVLDAPAPEGSFRPAPAMADKRPRWTVRQLDRSRLRSLPRPNSVPSLATVTGWFERPWIEQTLNWRGRYIHPRDNQPDYGREIAQRLANGLLSLQLNYTQAEKETLLIRLVQYGLDVYGAAQAGGRWNADGGHNQGRKLPLLLAGSLLNDPAILAYGDAARHFIFQEDQQTWYVQPSDVGRKLYTADGRPRETYQASDVGMAEWGEKHLSDPSRDGRNWSAYYRTVSGTPTFAHVLAARLMQLESAWNWPALFDYAERYWQQEKDVPTNGPNTLPGFVKELWSTHRYSLPSGNAGGISNPVTSPSLPTPSTRARVANISTRGRAGSGDQALIAGFVVGGSQPRTVLIRGVGPSLQAFGISGAMSDPQLRLFRGEQQLAESDNWGGEADAGKTAATGSRVGAFALDTTSRDAALVVTLEPGAYTALLAGRGTGTGVSLVEVYDAGDATTGSGLSNLSTRGYVGRDADMLIAGIVVADGEHKRLLIRAVGPSLSTFGVTGTLADPVLQVLRGSEVIAENDNWAATSETVSASDAAGAFALPQGSRDAAVIVTLSAGTYTAQVSGRAGATGVALVEVYELD